MNYKSNPENNITLSNKSVELNLFVITQKYNVRAYFF